MYINLIIQIENIEKKYPGGFEQYKIDNENRIAYDNYLVMKGAMSPWDMESDVKEVEEFGLTGVVEKNGVEQWQDFCVVEWEPTLPCDWIVVKDAYAYHKSDPERPELPPLKKQSIDTNTEIEITNEDKDSGVIRYKDRYLTKSRFKVAMECPKKLFYLNNPDTYANANEDDSFLTALAEGGFQVGALAKLYYPNGHEITEKDRVKSSQLTSELLQQENVVIYEAAICFENLFIRIDILEKKGDYIKLIEVKAKSFDDETEFTNRKGEITPEWKPYLYDVAFQKFVLQGAFPEFKIDSYLMLADKRKVATVSGLNQRFQLIKDGDNTTVKIAGDTSLESLGEPILITVDVSNLVENIHNAPNIQTPLKLPFDETVWAFADALKLYAPIGAHCGNCEFKTNDSTKKSGFMECWKEQTSLTDADFNKPLIFELWNFKGKQKCIEEGIYFLADLQKEHVGEDKNHKAGGGLSQKERQWMQVEKVRNQDNTVYLDLDGLKRELDSHIYPLHFIDFETSMVAIPFYEGSVPYEQIAFQYSHHMMEQDGTIRHESQFINTAKGEFPNFEFVRSLKKDLEQDNGTIFRFADHENTVLNQIKQQLLKKTSNAIPDRNELIAFIDSITHNKNDKRCGDRDMIDMCKIVKDYHYDPYTKGSNSIKAVLPAVIKRSAFIQNRYSQPICGKGSLIPSLNFDEPQIWIQKNELGEILSPYKLLPPLFEGVEAANDFMTDENLADGGAALTAYAKMQFTEMDEEERTLVVKGLLRYCELDTLAMVMIYEYWRNELSSK
jgi:hypothetical protein